MCGERYPKDLIVTAEDFSKSGWKQAVASAKREGYAGIWSALSEAAKKAMEEGDKSKGKVLWLLADACSMMLKPESNNEPFKPMMVMPNGRSAIPEDFSEADIKFFAETATDIDNPWLQARLADVVWLCATPRDPDFAKMAIDAYRKIPLDKDTWISDGGECWKRAAGLARMLGNGTRERLKEIGESIMNAFDSAGADDGYLALWLSDLLDDNTQLLIRDQVRPIAEHLEELAHEIEKTGDQYRCRDYFDRAAKWFRNDDDEAKATEMTVAVAECWVREAEARIAAEQNPSHMVAASFYENAIQTYRTIPRAQRALHKVDERMAELRAKLSESGKRALEEMGTITTEGIDISEMVEKARDSVRGKSANDALGAFAGLYQINAKSIRETAIKNLKAHPLTGLFPATVRSRDGRVIAKKPGMSLGDSSSEDDDAAIQAEMIRNYSVLVGIVVQADIVPALEILIQEHRLREADFVGLASQSPIVPKDRARLFGKALFAGYDQDFVSAIHLLAPQIENMVRFHLKDAGVQTTCLDQKGIETENGLSTLMELPEVERIFGPDLAFEIRAIYCNAMGPNLRNETAHGLITYEGCQSIFAVYAWWLGLRLVFIAYWNSLRGGESDKETEVAT